MAYSLAKRARVASWLEWTKSITALQRKFCTGLAANRDESPIQPTRERFIPRRNRLYRNDEDWAGQGVPVEGSQTVNMLHVQQMLYKLNNMDNDARRFGRVDPRALKAYLDNLLPEDKITSPVALMLLKFCGSHLPMLPTTKCVEMIDKVWNLLKERNFQFDVSHYNSLLSLYLENDHDFSPVDILATMEKDGIEPNRVTFQRLIKHFAKTGDLNGVGTILEHMKSLDMPITEQVCNSLLFANIKAKNDEELKLVMEFMENNGIDLTSDSYFDMVCAHAENNDYENVLKIFNEQSETVFTDAQIFQLIYIFMKNGNKSMLQELLGRLRKTSGFLHEALNAALRINALGHYEQALEILSQIDRSTTEQGELVDIGGTLLQQSLDLEFSRENVLNICKLMNEKKLHKRALEITYYSACEASRKETATYLMEAIIQKINSNGDPRNMENCVIMRQQAFWPLIVMNAKENNIDGLRRVFGMMYSCHCHVDVQTLTEWMWPNLPDELGNDLATLERFRNELAEISYGKMASSYFLHKFAMRDSQAIKEMIISHGQYLTMMPNYAVDRMIRYMYQTSDVETVVEFLANRQTFFNNTKHMEWTSSFIIDFQQSSSPQLVTRFFDALVDKKVAISPDFPQTVKHWIFSKHPEIKDHFAKLAAFGDMMNMLIKNNIPTAITQPVDISSLDDAKLVDYVVRANFGILNQQIQMLLRTQQVDNLLRLNKAMESAHKHSTPSLYVSAMNVMLKVDDIESALQFYNAAFKVMGKYENFSVAPVHLLNLFNILADKQLFTSLASCSKKIVTSNRSPLPTTTQLVDNNNDNESNLNGSTKVGKDQFYSQFNDHLLGNLLDKLFQVYITPKSGDEATKDSVDMLEERTQIFENLCQYKDFGLSRFHTSFLMEQLINNRSKVAVKIFDILFRHTKQLTTPFKLMEMLALENNVADLQKVYDSYVALRGENSATIKLALALAMAGRTKDASRILSAPNIRFTTDNILYEGQLCFDKRDDKGLQCLLTLTRGKSHHGREVLYTQLLTIYRQKNDYQSALKVWTSMQEENFAISESILNLLSKILKENKQPVPFLNENSPTVGFQTGSTPTTERKSSSSLMSKLLKKKGSKIGDNLKKMDATSTAN